MDIKDYAQMMRYLTRPRDVVPDPSTMDQEPRNMAQGGRIGFDAGGDAVRLKALQADYDKFGKNKLDKGAKILGFKNYAALEGQDNANFRRKIRNELTQFGEVLTESGSRKRSRETRIPKEQGIQIKLLEETNKKNFFDPKQFAKANNITLPYLKKQAKRLQLNIYKKRMVESRIAVGKEGKDKLEWIPKDSTISDNALDKLWKSKLIVANKNKIDELFYQAFGNPKSKNYQPKKFLAIKKNLNEYRQLKDAINKKYPNINFELDHPLSKSSLNNLFNATTEQLTRVNPLDKDLNRGFKDVLSQQYEKAVQGNNLNKKKAVEKIARDLKLNIGKISDDATNFKYGVKEFQKLNIKDEIGKSLENLSSLNKNFQTYAKNNPDLFKTANINPNQTFTKIDNVKGLIPFMKELGIKCRLSNGVNCMNPQAYEKSLNELSEKAAQGDQAARNKLGKFTSKVATAGRFIKGALGPLAVASEVAIEGGIALNQTLNEGVPIKTAFADSLTNKYLLGPKLQIDKEAEIAKEFAKGEDFAMAERGRRMFLPEGAPRKGQLSVPEEKRLENRMQQMEQASPAYDPNKQQYTDQNINEYLKSIGQRELLPGEGTKVRMNIPQLGLFGTQEEFMEGGIASLNVKK